MSSSIISHELTDKEAEMLCKAAIDAKSTAYCPYSNFRVGAAILSENGEIITGANVENASTPVGTCAERCAFAKAVTSGHREFRALAVAADTLLPCSPCGMCRQFAREFCTKDMKVYMNGRVPMEGEDNYGKEGKREVRTLGALLPMSFGPEDLKDGKGRGGGT